jgi:hypothetical protein
VPIEHSPAFPVHDFIYSSHPLEASDIDFQFTTLFRLASRPATQNQQFSGRPVHDFISRLHSLVRCRNVAGRASRRVAFDRWRDPPPALFPQWLGERPKNGLRQLTELEARQPPSAQVRRLKPNCVDKLPAFVSAPCRQLSFLFTPETGTEPNR